jgi:hypothetical protein
MRRKGRRGEGENGRQGEGGFMVSLLVALVREGVWRWNAGLATHRIAEPAPETGA